MPYSKYLKAIQEKLHTGQAGEHSYRGLLEGLLANHVPDIAKDRYSIINEPSRVACGAPDFAILQKSDNDTLAVGYVEAKDIGVNLGSEEKSEQLIRYRNGLENLILTDYLEFRLFVNGEKMLTVAIAKHVGGIIKPLPENFEKLANLFNEFFTNQRVIIKSTEDLAKIMANKTKLMQDIFLQTLTNADKHSTINAQYKAFEKMLINDLSKTQFADIYAQTITYGLFTAKLQQYKKHNDKAFTKDDAVHFIPASNPFLQKLFRHISNNDEDETYLDDTTLWIIDNLCEVFGFVDWGKIRDAFNYDNDSAPIIHFYEIFLKNYNPSLKDARGVYYTPQPVVQFIIRAVDDCLKNHFNLADGLADTSKVDITVKDEASNGLKSETVHKVQLLDVATGTGTFLAEIIQKIHKGKPNQGASWNNYVEQHLLPRLHGFEILMASYAICHLQIHLLLEETGYQINQETPQRLGVYLTNALEEDHPTADLPFTKWLEIESNSASRIKREMPVMVAFGNPPYRGESKNKSDFIMKLMQNYKQEPSGGKLKERNPKWINDDYVKFIRMGEHYITKNTEGILAYITNHGYIDNPTFRGMRFHLLNAFDEIYIIDLHGNAKKKELAPDGKPDKNVFDIEQGVAIIIAVKKSSKIKSPKPLARIFHKDVYGSNRDKKYDWLDEHSLNNIDFTSVDYQAPYYFFCPKDFEALKQYEKGFHINKLFKLHNTGIVSKRDKMAFQHSKKDMENLIKHLLTLNAEQIREQYPYCNWDSRDGKAEFVVSSLKEVGFNQELLKICNYRPFDNRWTYYTKKSKGFLGWPVYDIMQHMLAGDNLGLCVGRQGQVVGSITWNLAFITNSIIDFNIYYRGGADMFPLYIYDTDSFNFGKPMRKPNLNQDMIDEFATCLKLNFIPDHEDAQNNDNANDKTIFNPMDILDYIYAVLHSPTYRETYQEFLKIDFPHIPYPKTAKQFWQLAALGGQIRTLHLLENPTLNTPITKWEVTGSDVIEKPIYKDGKIYINNTQYFDDAPEIAWQFYIGGYQPAQKWLKDRKGRKLDYDDVQHYQKIIIALTETHRLMQQIDKIAVI